MRCAWGVDPCVHTLLIESGCSRRSKSIPVLQHAPHELRVTGKHLTLSSERNCSGAGNILYNSTISTSLPCCHSCAPPPLPCCNTLDHPTILYPVASNSVLPAGPLQGGHPEQRFGAQQYEALRHHAGGGLQRAAPPAHRQAGRRGGRGLGRGHPRTLNPHPGSFTHPSRGGHSLQALAHPPAGGVLPKRASPISASF